jgi:hypothetical protein
LDVVLAPDTDSVDPHSELARLAKADVQTGESTLPLKTPCNRGAMMEFSALFLSVVVVMAVSWWGSRRVALALFTIGLIASVVTYLHHATDVLKLSF